jgi:hypothetical protein
MAMLTAAGVGLGLLARVLVSVYRDCFSIHVHVKGFLLLFMLRCSVIV